MIDDEETAFWLDGEMYNFELDFNGLEKVDNQDDVAIKKTKSAGCICIKCKDFYQYAESNQQDGTFKCWGCRH